jgi:hypothetical protein
LGLFETASFWHDAPPFHSEEGESASKRSHHRWIPWAER